jgi:hypothetical protein
LSLKKLPKVNNRSLGENSTNLVTLVAKKGFSFEWLNSICRALGFWMAIQKQTPKNHFKQ